ncbi:MAG: decaprenyl-phosphate phosphoribosyltransferase [Acidobacteriota bacterium]
MAQENLINVLDNRSEAEEIRKGLLRSILISMRPHQWVKNVFIFAPLLFGRKLTEMAAIGNSLLAFAVFCLLASALYIFNDWIDAEEDRAHPEKCRRPISSGSLPVPVALFAAAILAGTAFGLSATLGLNFFLIAALYVILTLSYCLVLKRMIVLDAMTISAGFVIRIVGGAIAVSVVPSHWLIICAFLLALFLTFTKRRQELLTLSDNAGDHRKVLKEYSVSYLGQVNNILIGASIVCYALYTVAPETIEKFNTENLIYGTVFVIYGMLRYMLLIEKPENGGNPSKMLLQDKPLLFTVIGWSIYNIIMVYHIYD